MVSPDLVDACKWASCLPERWRAGAAARSGFKLHASVVLAGLVAAFLLLQSRAPLGTAIQIGADEGFDLAKATLCLHGHRLYSEVWRSEEHTSELQSLRHLVCRLLLEKKNK